VGRWSGRFQKRLTTGQIRVCESRGPPQIKFVGNENGRMPQRVHIDPLPQKLVSKSDKGDLREGATSQKSILSRPMKRRENDIGLLRRVGEQTRWDGHARPDVTNKNGALRGATYWKEYVRRRP